MIDDSVTDVDARFMVLVCQMELERVQYLVQSYLRTRLFKVRRALSCQSELSASFFITIPS